MGLGKPGFYSGAMPQHSPRRPLAGLATGVLVAVLTAGLGACAVTPPIPRADVPLQQEAAPAVHKVAAQVSVTGHGGRLRRDEREQLLRRVGEQGSPTLVQRHLAVMSSFGEVDLYAGNEVRLLIDGPATFAAMLQAIEQARHSILLESYIIEDASISQRLAELLARKRAEGVEILVIYDAIGSIGTDKTYFDSLRQSGIAVCAFNPVNPVQRTGYWNITHRDHRKILVVDREIGFTGGINISAVYSSGSFGRQSGGDKRDKGDKTNGWRDTQIQLRGPAAGALEDLVRATWQHQGCRNEEAPTQQALKAQNSQAPHAASPSAASRSSATQAVAGKEGAPSRTGGSRSTKPMGGQLMRIVPSAPDDEFNRIYALLLTAIDASQRSVHLTMAYFAPGKDMVDALCDAAERGVDVQLVLPSLSDFTPVLHAGRSYYERLLKAGVKLYELQDAVLHAKTAVIDGVVSTVGSSNLDWRSFSGNNEVNAVVIGEDFGDAMGRMFDRDVAASQPVTLESWLKRPLWQRAKESMARLFESWW